MIEHTPIETAPVAVVIPTCNYGEFIGATIESILNQTLPVAELIVVDDGSTDDTPDVCARYPTVKYIGQDNKGISSARNRGLHNSSADYIMFSDADDMLVPEGIETLWKTIAEAPVEVKVCFGWNEHFQASSPERNVPGGLQRSEEIMAYAERNVGPDAWILSDLILERLLQSNIVPQCGSLIHRSVYDHVGEWDCRFQYHEDRDMWMRIAARYPLCFVNKPVGRKRLHDDNVTHNKNWIRNHRLILDVLDATAHADWASPRLQSLARARYATGAYFLAQRLAESGELSEARRLMRAALARRPYWPKPALRWLEYCLRGLLPAHATEDA